MMKFKTVSLALLLLGAGHLWGQPGCAVRSDSEKQVPTSRHARARAKSRKSKAQPALVTLGDYVVEPPDMLIVEVLDALPGRPISGRAPCPARRQDLAWFLRRHLCGRTDDSGSQGKGRPAFAKVSQRRRTRARRSSTTRATQ